MSKLSSSLDRRFKISARGSSMKVEIFAGITTFLAMCYILVVNPNVILSTFLYAEGMPTEIAHLWSSVFLATVFGSIIGTLLMAFGANMPYAQAPGMGLNSQVGGLLGGFVATTGTFLGMSFGTVMLMVLISGIIFLALTVIPCGRDKETKMLISMREKIFDGIPVGIRAAIPVGIGLFIAFVGLQNAKIVQGNPLTIISLVNFSNWSIIAGEALPAVYSAVVCLIGLMIIAILAHFKVKGATIIGILGATAAAIFMSIGLPEGTAGIVDFATLTENGTVTWKFWKNFTNFFSFSPSKGGTFFACFTDVNFTGQNVMVIIMTIISFCMIDMFDTMGTIMGCASKAGLLDAKGKPLAYGRCMYADSIATVTGACLGTSTVTTYVESGTGVAVGAKTGMTALVVAILFFLSLFLLPVFAFIPSAACACALIYVGVIMMTQVKNIDFKDIRIAVPAFLAIVIMPLGYSITNGIGMAMLSYVVIAFFCWLVDICKYASAKKTYAVQCGAAQSYAIVFDITYDTNRKAVYTRSSLGSLAPKKPIFPISVITAIVAGLFVIYFFVPKS